MKTTVKSHILLSALALSVTSAFVITAQAQQPKPAVQLELPVAPGPFQPSYQSLSNYHCPDWFRDAKFGIWAHWGPQAVPMDGDWYARGMYEEGNGHYKHHLANYGHPSTNGYKDIIPLWKAEKWDPDRLMALYKQAGARYFVSMGSHHDNFYLWNSKLHKWNAVNMGPKRDVVGDWQKAATKYGLRFGVSEHLGASFTWFQSSHRADRSGSMAGVPYDGADPKYQDLYHFPADPNDRGWYSNNPRWQQMWYDRIKELVDNYSVDLLYTDGGVPFGNVVGLSAIANLYNRDLLNHLPAQQTFGRKGAELLRGSPATEQGRPEVVYCCKQQSRGMWIEDLERGVMARINPYPWQTDTSIGDWYYNRNWKFRPVSWSIHMLVDIVSKNGNLLLNVVQRPDGSLDAEVEQALEQMAAWIAIHGEAIYGTRPWLVYGEGAVKAKGGSFGEDFKYSSTDIRFTTKGQTLYAVALGWPEDGQLTVKSLATPAGLKGNVIQRVELLGHQGALRFTQTTNGLVVTLPAQKPSEYTAALRIFGSGLTPVQAAVAVSTVRPDPQGTLVLLPGAAETQGGVKEENQGGEPNLGFWDNPQDSVSWKANFTQPGKFQVTANCSTVFAGSEFVVEVAGRSLAGKALQTGAWDKFNVVDLGQIEIKQPGALVVQVRPKSAQAWKAINLRWVKFTRAE
jgi:alpha-L-fucosidase